MSIDLTGIRPPWETPFYGVSGREMSGRLAAATAAHDEAVRVETEALVAMNRASRKVEMWQEEIDRITPRVLFRGHRDD